MAKKISSSCILIILWLALLPGIRVDATQSAWPLFEKAEHQVMRWTKEGIGPNAALLVGHGSVLVLYISET